MYCKIYTPKCVYLLGQLTIHSNNNNICSPNEILCNVLRVLCRAMAINWNEDGWCRFFSCRFWVSSFRSCSLVIFAMNVKSNRRPKIDGHYHCINNIQLNQFCQAFQNNRSNIFRIDNFQVNAFFHWNWDRKRFNGMNLKSSIAENLPKPSLRPEWIDKRST